MSAGTVLVLAPMPAFPTSAGNRRRLLATCEALQRGGFAIDLAYYAHEDQIYRRFGQHPPTDFAAMDGAFRRTFLIETRRTIPLKTRARCFGIDEWCPDEVGAFVSWYFARHPGTCAILANYVFLSRALEQAPPGVLRLIDTHDRFAGRQRQYRPFRAEPNFFYTDEAGEAAGLARADLSLAIQSLEARYFSGLAPGRVHLLPPRFPTRRAFAPVAALRRIGFIGHGNDPNLFSIGKFAHAWADGWTPDRPELVVAGEICASLSGLDAAPGVRLLGYVARIEDFYDDVEVVVAPMLMGSGLKMKVAEALSFGRPVVGTEIGFEGFEPVARAHLCRGVEGVKAEILALKDDKPALAALVRASEDLFSRYNAEAAAAEASFLEILRAHAGLVPSAVPSPSAASPASADPPLHVHRLGPAILAVVRDRHSLERSHPVHGVLVATERLPGDGTDAAYDATRRRWFARAATDRDPVAQETHAAPFGGSAAPAVALAPEWVRDRLLPPPVRAALAQAFARTCASARPDWRATGRVVGRRPEAEGGALDVVLFLPSFLASGSHPCAAFLAAPQGPGAVELRFERVAPLHLLPGTTFADVSARGLTPVPATVTLAPLERGAAAPVSGRLLLLTDDLIGCIDLSDPEGASAP